MSYNLSANPTSTCFLYPVPILMLVYSNNRENKIVVRKIIFDLTYMVKCSAVICNILNNKEKHCISLSMILRPVRESVNYRTHCI